MVCLTHVVASKSFSWLNLLRQPSPAHARTHPRTLVRQAAYESVITAVAVAIATHANNKFAGRIVPFFASNAKIPVVAGKYR